ncbi:acyl-CoA dehydrogenase [Rhodopseudomonas boonkerdii]|uniref:acyl-CoA dehydrogenase family protein n=1 Tax=Rhodopseudomonas boonkerdii TaxID=475937 RepID=UPI001E5D18C9|nr:acyl-CoA dehydrogenase family protein [Rhodopseudomonas boonkerdii]UGV28655.1 acyl-CoA dehydrogenase [Rhodopseudomonas boonkerdii]
MDLSYGPRYLALREEVRDFIKQYGDQSPRTGGGRKRPDKRALDWQRLLLQRGYFARTIPKEYGGFGLPLDVMELAIIADEFSTAGVSAGIMNQGISMLVPTLLEVGSREQCAKWIGPTIRGEVIWCQGYSEPGSGSDLAAVKTHAYVDDGRFVINGQKIWTSSAHFADMMFLLCRTDADKGKHGGLSYLLIPMSAEGIEVRPLITMTGRAEFNETFLTNVRVPIDQTVMQRGDGWHVANVTSKYERLLLGDPNKLAHRLARVIELMRRTSLIGVPTIEIPEYRDRLLKLQGEVLASKFHGLRLLSEQSRDEESGVRRLIVKLNGTMIAYRLSSLAVDVLGAAGLSYEPKGEALEDDEATTWQIDNMYDIGLIIGGGSSNIQKNIIGERGLGLPREPTANTKSAQKV